MQLPVARPRARVAVICGGGVLGLVLLFFAAQGHLPVSHAHLTPNDRWFLIGLAYSCLLGAGLAALRAPIAGAFAALLFMGSLAQLWFTEPDWLSPLRFRLGAPVDRVMAAALAAEGLVALACVARWIGARNMRAGIQARDVMALAALLLLTTFGSVVLSSSVAIHAYGRYVGKLVVAGGLATMHITLIAAIIGAPDLPCLWENRRIGSGSSNAVPLIVAIVVAVVSSLLARTAFHGLGLVEDETAYLFQAKTFAGGVLAAPPLPHGTDDAFSFYLLQSGKAGWIATPAPGWSAVLSLGWLLGIPWLVNPLLAALSVLLAHRLVERCSDRWTANVAALLMATSPWLLETSASLMTHALSLVLILGAWLSLVIARERVAQGRGRSAAALCLVAGLLMGALFVNRALEGVVIGSLSGLWLIWSLRTRAWQFVPIYGLGCIAVSALIFPYNAHFTGNPLVAPLAAYLAVLWQGTGNDFGFGPHVGPPPTWSQLDLWPGHSPLEGLINIVDGIRALNLELFGWTIGSLFLVWIYAIWGKGQPLARTMAVVGIAVIGIHFFYWFNAIYYIGPRYWYAAYFPFVALSACGAAALADQLQQRGIEQARGRVVATLVLLALFGLTVFTPWRAYDKYAARARLGVAVQSMISRPEFADAVVFLPHDAYHASAILNDPFLRPGHAILVQDLGPASDARVLGAFPGRRAAHVTFDPRNHATVAFGPVH